MLHASVAHVVREEGGGARAAVLGAVAATLLVSRTAGGELERAQRARADAAEGLDDDGDAMLFFFLMQVLGVAELLRRGAPCCRSP